MREDIYLEHSSGFSERSYTLLPDPDFLYRSKGQKCAYTVPEYGLRTHAPLTVVSGKTTLLAEIDEVSQVEEEIIRESTDDGVTLIACSDPLFLLNSHIVSASGVVE